MTRVEAGLSAHLQQELKQVLTPAQLQSLQLLSMPIQELEAYVDECLLSNPVLELEPAADPSAAGEAVAPVVFTAEGAPESGRSSYQGPEEFFQQIPDRNSGDSLRELLCLQASVMALPAPVEYALKCLISALDQDGYLRMDEEELSQAFSIEKDHIEAALPLLHSMEPKGVGARNLGECLRLQVPETYPFYPLLEKITLDYLPELAANDSQAVAAALQVSQREVRQVFGYLRSLEPYPAGELEQGAEIHYSVPDVVVEPIGNSWCVRLNDQVHSGLLINPYYAGLAEHLPDGSSRDYLQQQMRDARSLLQAVRRRHETLLRLAGLLMRYQAGFLYLGPLGLKPLRMTDLAEQAECHPSTVSRAAAGKYIQTPRGVYPWSYFFPQGIPTGQGRFTTDAYVRMRIAALIHQEDPEKPFSDQAITDLLRKEDICIARRTVAKYRQDLAILPRSLRRRKNFGLNSG